MGNASSSSDSSHAQLSSSQLDTLSKSFATFNDEQNISNCNCIHAAFKKTIRHLIQENMNINKKHNSSFKAWCSISTQLTGNSPNYALFIQAYSFCFPFSNLGEFLAQLSVTLNLYSQSDPDEINLLSEHLLDQCKVYSEQTIDQELSNSAKISITPTLMQFEQWLTGNVLIQKLLSSLFNYIFYLLHPRSLPTLQSKSLLLSNPHLFVLDSLITSKQREWRMSFGSKRDGHSWASFSNRIQSSGPTIIIIKDFNGNIFGAFTSKSILKDPNFQKDESSFLFVFKPQLRIFLPTNQNLNHVYFNYQTQSLPNGLGFGGQLDYFGLWISSDFINGHSLGKPSSTYGNLPLTVPSYFQVEYVESWCVEEVETDDRLQQSITMNEETKALLEMSGKTIWSNTLKKPDEDI